MDARAEVLFARRVGKNKETVSMASIHTFVNNVEVAIDIDYAATAAFLVRAYTHAERERQSIIEAQWNGETRGEASLMDRYEKISSIIDVIELGLHKIGSDETSGESAASISKKSAYLAIFDFSGNIWDDALMEALSQIYAYASPLKGDRLTRGK